MPDPHFQQEPYYALHRTFTDRYRCRVARRLGVPPLTLAAYYAVMHDIASNAGTFGEFTTDVRAFEEAIGMPERQGTSAVDCARDAELANVWRLLEKAQLVEIIEGAPEAVEGLDGFPVEFRVRVLGVADVNQPRGRAKSGAERQAKYVAKKRNAAASVEGDGRLRLVAGEVTQNDARRHCDADPPTHTGRHNPAVPTGFPLLLEVDRQERNDRHADRFELAGSARTEMEEIPWGEAGERLDSSRRDLPTAAHPTSCPQSTTDTLGGVA